MAENENSGRTSRDQSRIEVFRHSVAPWPFALLLAAFIFPYGGYLIFRDPAWISPKGILIVLIWGGANLVLLDLIRKLWLTRSMFVLSATNLLVFDRILRTRMEVPWGAVVSVDEIPRFWWNRGGGLVLNEIAAANGPHILFGTHMNGYSAFLQNLKARATHCRRFNPYSYGIGERRPSKRSPDGERRC